jgi:hypothetical protein
MSCPTVDRMTNSFVNIQGPESEACPRRRWEMPANEGSIAGNGMPCPYNCKPKNHDLRMSLDVVC